jgi:hypothetical protein
MGSATYQTVLASPGTSLKYDCTAFDPFAELNWKSCVESAYNRMSTPLLVVETAQSQSTMSLIGMGAVHLRIGRCNPAWGVLQAPALFA